MALRDPIACYDAADNLEGLAVRDALVNAGVAAFVVVDDSHILTGWLGPVSQFNKHHVWIERADADRAGPVLEEFERLLAARREPEQGAERAAEAIRVVCEECHRPTKFPAAQQGSVQSCPRCGAYVDVSHDNIPDEWRVQLGPEPDEWGIQSEEGTPG